MAAPDWGSLSANNWWNRWAARSASSVRPGRQHLYLHCLAGSWKRKSIEQKERHPVSLKALKVLVVDDSEEDRAILTTMLSDLSCKTTCVGSGAMALTELEKKKNRFDLALIDWNMPDMDGIEVAERIKNHPD